jgi:hypothetical protein
MARWSRNGKRDRHRLAAWEQPVTLRLADEADAPGLERLAQLDSSPLPPGPYLVAERDRRMEAAISLVTGELIADPFRRTAELRDLLRRHGGDLPVAEAHAAATPLEPRPKLVTT